MLVQYKPLKKRVVWGIRLTADNNIINLTYFFGKIISTQKILRLKQVSPPSHVDYAQIMLPMLGPDLVSVLDAGIPV